VPHLIWEVFINFSSNATALVALRVQHSEIEEEKKMAANICAIANGFLVDAEALSTRHAAPENRSRRRNEVPSNFDPNIYNSELKRG
jgi:hypothetical protein